MYIDILNHKRFLKDVTNLSNSNKFINSNISFDEVENVNNNNAKMNNAYGVDNICILVLTNKECKMVL